MPTRTQVAPQLVLSVNPALPIFQQNVRRHRIQSYLILLLADLMCIFAGFAVGSLVRFGDFSDHTWVRISLAVAPLFIGSAMHNRAYSLESLKSVGLGIGRVFAALVSAFAVLFVISYFLKAEQDVSRLAVATGVAATFAFAAVARKYVVELIRHSFAGELTTTVVIADETFFDGMPGAVQIDALQAGIRPEPRNPVMIQRLVQLLAGTDRVVIACRRETSASWAAMIKVANVRGEIVADEVQSVGAVGVGRAGDRPTLVVATGPLSAQQRAVKRAFDLAIAVPALIFIAPVLAAVAIAIMLESPGPILFRQQRVGFGNGFFHVFKFRSMAAQESDGAGTTSTAVNDARVTRVGRFIRRTSLDELPQLFNVIAGSMSLVGPRPHAIGSFAGPVLFWDVDDRYAHRHLLKPGITGLAQVRGQRGTAHRVDDLSQRLQSDLEYMADWSVWGDVMIVLKTFGVLMHPNAY